MSYDFYISVDTGGPERHYIEPYFSDEHPAVRAHVAENVLVTDQGYARCGNYTSNVSGMWAKCLTAALERVPEARKWIAADAKAFNASGRTCSRLVDGEWQRNVPMPESADTLCLRDLHGQLCDQLAPLLAAAVEWGVEHLDELHEMDPDNGWGDADGAVTYLWDIQRMCEMHPKGRLEISS